MRMVFLARPYFVFAGFDRGCLEIRIPVRATKNKAIYPPIDLYLTYLCVHPLTCIRRTHRIKLKTARIAATE